MDQLHHQSWFCAGPDHSAGPFRSLLPQATPSTSPSTVVIGPHQERLPPFPKAVRL